MRCLALLLVVSGPAWADILTPTSNPPIIAATPIPVTGSGVYDALFCCGGGWGLQFSFSGTNGVDTVSLSANGGFDMGDLGNTVPAVLTNIGINHFLGTATIDGLTAGLVPFSLNGNVQFTLGQGSGRITITPFVSMGPGSSLLAQADLIGYVSVTSEVRQFGALFPNGPVGLLRVHDTFDIVPTPEPASSAVVGTVLIVVAFALRARSIKG
jgi:hypothetical protein